MNAVLRSMENVINLESVVPLHMILRLQQFDMIVSTNIYTMSTYRYYKD